MRRCHRPLTSSRRARAMSASRLAYSWGAGAEARGIESGADVMSTPLFLPAAEHEKGHWDVVPLTGDA